MTSSHRTSPAAGRVNLTHVPRSPQGRPLCRACGLEVGPRRRSFCSDACVHHWRLRTDPNYVREAVLARDHGRCAACAINTEAQKRELTNVPMRKRRAWLTARGIPWARRFGRWWDADHIRPVAEGGGECDLANYQTLCLACHRSKTAAQAARRKQARLTEKLTALDTILYHYRGDRLTDPARRGAVCRAVRRPEDGQGIRGQNGAMLVEFVADGARAVVLGRQLRRVA